MAYVTRWFVRSDDSEVWSDGFCTKEEAEKELREEKEHAYGSGAVVVEIEFFEEDAEEVTK